MHGTERYSCTFVIELFVVGLLMSACDVEATNNIDTTVFTVVKSAAHVEFCDVGTSPATKIFKVSAVRCAAECQREGDLLACRGYNYLSGTDGNSCELHSGDDWPMFGTKQGCKYFTRGTAVFGYIGRDPNRALNQPSSEMVVDGWASSELANDGNYNTQSCTLYGDRPWWSVDLGSSFYVTSVKVINDNSSTYAKRLDNFTVWLAKTPPTVGQTLDTSAYTLCHQYIGSVPALDIATVTCDPSSLVNRYVIIQSSYLNYALCLTEVEVFTDPNQARNQRTSQVNTYELAGSWRATDGSSWHSCTDTFDYPWLSVDLGTTFYVTSVNITNYVVVEYAYRLANFKLWLANTPPIVGRSLVTSTYTLCHKHTGSVPAGATVMVSCPYSSRVYRYVIIQSSFRDDPLCLTEVEVYTG